MIEILESVDVSADTLYCVAVVDDDEGNTALSVSKLTNVSDEEPEA